MGKNVLETKSIFMWQLKSCFAGNPYTVADFIGQLGLESVAIKVMNGLTIMSDNLNSVFLAELRKRNIKIIGWGCSYGVGNGVPQREGQLAGELVKEYQLDAFIWDQEATAEAQADRLSDATHTATEFRKLCPNLPMALCWWPYPKSPTTWSQWHPIDYALIWEKYIDYYMPMMYWFEQSATSALYMLAKSFEIYRSFTNKPIIPVGRAYNGDFTQPGATVQPEAVLAFAEEAFTKHKVAGISWWVLDQVGRLPQIEQALKYVNQNIYTFPEIPEPPIESIRKLMQVDPALGTNLNLRITPQIRNYPKGELPTIENCNLRGGLGAGEYIEVLDETHSADGYDFVPVLLYVAKKFLKDVV